MAWLVIDENGEELKFKKKPYRECHPGFCSIWKSTESDNPEFLPKGTIKTLIGKNLTYWDKPYKIKEE